MARPIKGEKGEGWRGRNYQASNNMKKMKIGDQVFLSLCNRKKNCWYSRSN